MTTLVKILFEKNRVIAVGRLLKIVAGRLLCATIARNGNARGYPDGRARSCFQKLTTSVLSIRVSNRSSINNQPLNMTQIGKRSVGSFKMTDTALTCLFVFFFV